MTRSTVAPSKLWLALRERLDIHGNLIPKFLDSGAYASVYDLKDGRVLKITRDPSDAATMQSIMNDPSKYIVRVHDVCEFEFIKRHSAWNHSLYFIVADKLEEPSCDWRNFAWDVSGSWDGLRNLVPWQVRRSQNQVQFSDHCRDKWTWLMKVAKELKKRGISWRDFHGGNLMYDSNRRDYVLMDLGHTSNQGEPCIEKINI